MDYSQAMFLPQQIKKENESYSLKRMTNDDEIQKLLLFFRGYTLKYNENDQGWFYYKDQNTKPLMNEKGISFITSCLNMITSKGVVSGYTDDDSWRKSTERVLNDMAKGFVIEYEKYEIDKDKLTFLYGSIRNLVFTNSTRAIDGFEAQNTAPNIVEQYRPSNVQQIQSPP